MPPQTRPLLSPSRCGPICPHHWDDLEGLALCYAQGPSSLGGSIFWKGWGWIIHLSLIWPPDRLGSTHNCPAGFPPSPLLSFLSSASESHLLLAQLTHRESELRVPLLFLLLARLLSPIQVCSSAGLPAMWRWGLCWHCHGRVTAMSPLHKPSHLNRLHSNTAKYVGKDSRWELKS